MEYIITNPTDIRIQSLIDPNTRSIIASSDSYSLAIVCVENSSLISFGVFSIYNSIPTDAQLNYIYTAPIYRKKGMISQLLNYSKEYFCQKGILTITAKIKGHENECNEIMAYMNHWKFKALDFSERLITYLLPEMNLSDTINTIKGSKNALKNIISITDRHDKKLSAFIADDHTFDINTYDTEFSKFVINNNKITNAIIATQVSKDTVYISDIFIEDQSAASSSFLPLLCSVLSSCKEELGEDLQIIMSVNNKVIWDGLHTILGSPIDEIYVLNFIMLTSSMKGGQ